MDMIQRAEAFARRVHTGHRRKGAAAEPYTVHLEEVAALTARFGGTAEEVSAAWLHDTVEDVGVTPEALRAVFGAEVAALVAELTDDKSLPKAERKRLQIVNAPKKSRGAALVKLCDKSSNVRFLRVSPPPDWEMARRLAYLDHAQAVIERLPDYAGGHSAARDWFDEQVAHTRAHILRSDAESFA